MINLINFTGVNSTNKVRINNNHQIKLNKCMSDVFVRSPKMENKNNNKNHDAISYALSDLKMNKILPSLLKNNSWNNGVEDIKIFYKDNKPSSVSIDLFDFETGEHNVHRLSPKNFIKVLSNAKNISDKKYPETKNETNKLYDLLVKKINS